MALVQIDVLAATLDPDGSEGPEEPVTGTASIDIVVYIGGTMQGLS